MIDEKDLKLYFIMGSTNTKQEPGHVLQQAIDGGVTTFQYREKGPLAKTGDEKRKLGIELRNICLKNKVPFIVNDDLELAMKLHASGVHIGQEDGSLPAVRGILPAHMAIGVSVSTVEEALVAESQGADYLGVGPIYQTTTKADAREPIGLQRLQEIRLVTSIPIVAISGINKQNAKGIMHAGASGISVVSAISQAEDSQVAASELDACTKLNEFEIRG
ncbi:thiamine phosphate synthase [Virgibacillus phasianinus]|uniref:Thiamine-phosphate synthase n=1 Tax=Virgibacillus phasianinus TaxID=2017483 RepID=A0A220U119_9BACI|nr:thiamine phosphate synthase [Virgibacillus phasianinus]ASK61521.1 thiamine phosphate synthase [Virgibacillus phasianinus]